VKKIIARLNAWLDVAIPVPAAVGRALARGALWLGHYQLPVYMVLLSTGVARSLRDVTGWTWLHIDEVLRDVHSVATGLLVLVVLVAVPYHAQNLCDRDIRDATVLLDPQGEVERRRGHLRRLHWVLDDGRRRIGFLLILVLPMLLSTVTQPMLGLGSDQVWNWVALIGYAAVQLPVLGVFMWMERLHSRMEPWCPFCDHGGGGGRDRFEPVDPNVPTGQRKPQPA
jgi:hypothetical protein